MVENRRLDRPPFPPSWVDRLLARVERLPGPTWLFYAVAMLALWLLISVVLWIDGSVPFGIPGSIPGIFPPLVIYYLALYHYLTRFGSRSLEGFSPLLGQEPVDLSRIAYEFATLPRRLGLAAIVFGLVFTPPYVLGDRLAFGDLVPRTALPVLVAFGMAAFVGATFSAVIARSLRQLRMVHELHARATGINLLALEPAHAFSALTARTGIGLLIVVPIGYLYFPVAASSALILFAYGVIAALALVIFVAPVIGMRGRIAQVRRRALQQTADLLESTNGLLHRSIGQGEFGQMSEMESAIGALIREREMLAKIPTWPWDPATLRGFGSTLLLPIFLWLVTRLLETVL